MTINGGTTVTYTPATNFGGADSFTYSIGDGNGGSATGTVSISLFANEAPEANTDTATTAYNLAKIVSAFPGLCNSFKFHRDRCTIWYNN